MKAFTLNASELAMAEDFVADHRSAESAKPAWARLLCRQFCARVGDAAAWQELSVEEKLALPRSQRRVASWLLASGRAEAPADYLVGPGAFLGDAFARSHRLPARREAPPGCASGPSGTPLPRAWPRPCRATSPS